MAIKIYNSNNNERKTFKKAKSVIAYLKKSLNITMDIPLNLIKSGELCIPKRHPIFITVER